MHKIGEVYKEFKYVQIFDLMCTNSAVNVKCAHFTYILHFVHNAYHLCTLIHILYKYVKCAHMVIYVPSVLTVHDAYTVHTMSVGTACAHCEHQCSGSLFRMKLSLSVSFTS